MSELYIYPEDIDNEDKINLENWIKNDNPIKLNIHEAFDIYTENKQNIKFNKKPNFFITTDDITQFQLEDIELKIKEKYSKDINETSSIFLGDDWKKIWECIRYKNNITMG